jgi:predicted MPP superfamily phosphohydrolase
MHERIFNGLLAALELGVLLTAASSGRDGAVLLAVAGLFAVGVLGALSPHFVEGGHGGFFALKLLSWVVFVHLPAMLLGSGAYVRGRSPRMSMGLVLGGLAIAAAGVFAFLVEPERTQLVTYRVEHAAVTRPFRIALIADLQTQEIGEHELRALAMMAEAEPDLVLFAGDYIQQEHSVSRNREQDRLRDALAQLQLSPRLGAWAVGGDVETAKWAADWKRGFEGLPVTCIEQTRTLQLEPGLQLTLLHIDDSRSRGLEIPANDAFQLVLGHSPDHALSPLVHADLLLAGHTHGGQVRLPWFGPPVILSHIPRAWSRGRTELPSGATLIVSAGIGMERGEAPPIRFLCPPEVVIVNVVPAVVASR